MLLLTFIKPRTSGVVVVREGNKEYRFEADASGDLVGQVDDEALVRRLLLGGSFQPADEADFATAEGLLAAGEDADGPDADPDDDVDFDAAALPVEANTAPVVRRKPGRPRKG